MPKYVRCDLPLHGERLDYTSIEQLKDMVERLPLGSYDFESIRYASEFDQNGHDADVNGDCHRSLRTRKSRGSLVFQFVPFKSFNSGNPFPLPCHFIPNVRIFQTFPADFS
nr:Brevis radix-like domain-containing protein [Tanacetum cinerariifolium]